MGEVWRARDSRLSRDVALKILPEQFATDPERLARFKREAQVLASLNHPNIGGIYGLEESNGVQALVLELVEGPTLADRIAQGPIPLDEALPIAKQIAEALETAHEQGIIHRDLKPSNIKLRPDGTVKVLDFGLAKALDSSPGANDVSDSPTITSPAMTRMGVILGTAAYMSPEQARGKPVDKRADIWAFGCVLHEMLSGRRLFAADEVSDTLAFVLTREPDWNTLPADTPAAIRRLLRRCLAKDRSNRLPDIGAARLDIDDARTEASRGPVDPRAGESSGTSKRQTVAWAIGAVALAVVTALVGWMATRARPVDRSVARVLLGVAPADRLLSGLRLDSSTGRGRPSRTAMVFAPDGRSIVFNAEHSERVQLYLRRLDRLDASPIPGTEGASNPFFSPDGQWLGFHADGALKKVPLAGGPVVVLCPVDLVFGATWGSTNQIVFAAVRGGLQQVSAAGGTPTTVTTLESKSGEVSHRLPQFLPDGKTVLFTVTKSLFPSWDDTLIAAQSVATGQRTVLVEGGADARFVAATKHLVYLRRGTLTAVPFDSARLEVTSGAAVGVVADVMQAASIQPVQIDTGAGQFDVSASGSLVYATGGVFPQDRWSIVWVDRTGRTEPLRIAPGSYLAPRLSPDGKRVAFGTTAGDWDLWTYDVARGITTRLPMEGEQSLPLWTPDGSRFAFTSLVKSSRSVLLINPDGTGNTETLVKSEGWPNSWMPDGSALAFAQYDGRMWLVGRDGKEPPRALMVSSAPSNSQFDFSPDGRWLAYGSVPNPMIGPGHVYVNSYPAFDRREQISVENGAAPAWRRDGRELYFVHDASADGPLKIRMMAVPITTTPTFSAGAPRMVFEGPFRIDGPFRGYDVTPDGQRFLMVREIEQPPSRVSQMVLVQNWIEELKRLVPTN
jgi:serine/threonine-protein kinase